MLDVVVLILQLSILDDGVADDACVIMSESFLVHETSICIHFLKIITDV